MFLIANPDLQASLPVLGSSRAGKANDADAEKTASYAGESTSAGTRFRILRTANRHWAYAKAWLFQALEGIPVRKKPPP